MPDQPRVLYEVKQHIAFVTMNRPEKHNGLDMAMFREMIATAKKIRKDRSIRCVILSGKGTSFCAGLDFQAVSKEPRASSFICTYVAIIHRYISLAVNNNIIESLMS